MSNKDKITPQKYNELKKRAFAFEKNNKNSIIVFPARGDGSWYRIGGNSVLFYQFLVMDELGLGVNIREDDDYKYKFESGIITIRNLELFQRRLERAGILASVESGGGCYLYKLSIELTDNDIVALRKRETLRKEKLHEIVKPTYMNAELYAKMISLVRQINQQASKKQDNFARVLYANDLCLEARTTIEHYLTMSTSKDAMTSKNLRMLKNHAQNIANKLQIIAELTIWPADRCVMLGTLAIDLKEKIEEEISTYKENERKKREHTNRNHSSSST